MKQELTFAAVLLAVGSLLWFSSSGSTNTVQPVGTSADRTVAKNDSGQTTSMIPMASSLPSESGLYPTSQASYQTELIDETPKPESLVIKPDSTLVAQRKADFDLNRPEPDAAAINLLANTANQLANSNPFAMQVRMEANMFGQHIIANGDYFQMGQGTHKTRIELTFESMKNQPSLTQVCDGRFFYTVNSNGAAKSKTAEQGSANQNVGASTDSNFSDGRTLEFVDLLRVQQAAGEQATQLTPTGWVATGGLSSLLQHLASGFNFGPPETIGENLILIRGQWDEAALRQIVANSDNKPNLKLGTPIDWNRVPKQLPHAVEFVFKQTPSGVNIPRQVSFLRFVADESNPASQFTTTASMVLSFSDPRDLKNLAEGFFVIDSSNLEPTDATDRYIARIESFHESLAEQNTDKESTIER